MYTNCSHKFFNRGDCSARDSEKHTQDIRDTFYGFGKCGGTLEEYIAD